jgi:hypothetical protein
VCRGRRFGFWSHIEAVLPKIGSSLIQSSVVIQSNTRHSTVRIPLAITSVALIALHGTANAGPLQACAQVSALVDEAVRPLLADLAESQPDATQLRAQFRACLSSRNICGVVHNARNGKEALVEGDVTGDLPAQYLSERDKPPVTFLVRSIPRVRSDSNRYCLVSEQVSGATSAQQWDIYGWVIAPNATKRCRCRGRFCSIKRYLTLNRCAAWRPHFGFSPNGCQGNRIGRQKRFGRRVRAA